MDVERAEFDSWVSQVGPALHRTGFLLTGDWQAAQDLVVAACAQTHADWARVAAAAPESYARAVMARTASTHRRRRSAGQGLTGRPAAVAEALDAMDPSERTALVLQYYDGLTEDEVAEDLDWPVEEVRDATDRALDELRARGLDDGWVPA